MVLGGIYILEYKASCVVHITDLNCVLRFYVGCAGVNKYTIQVVYCTGVNLLVTLLFSRLFLTLPPRIMTFFHTFILLFDILVSF